MMDPTTIALVCATVFGVIGILSAFIRQLLLSREKKLNDLAQQNALHQETIALEQIRQEMKCYKRFDLHYQVLGENKETVQYIDKRIEDTLKKKSDLIQRYAETTLRESSAIIAGESDESRKLVCDQLRDDIACQLKFQDSELDLLQKRRATLWDTHKELLTYLVEQEKLQNDHLDALYQHHSALLEKVYLRHNQNCEAIAVKTIDASNGTFKAALMAPIYFLMGLFKVSANIDPDKADKESLAREEVLKFELDINAKTTQQMTSKKVTATSTKGQQTGVDEDVIASESLDEPQLTDHCHLKMTSTV